MKLYDALCIGGNVFTYILSAVQTSEILQIISFVLSILTSLIILMSKILKWWIKAKEDNKITPEELEELADIISDTEKELEKEKETKENDKNK